MANGALDRGYRPLFSADSDGLFLEHPNVYAGWTFLLHFAVFTALTYLVAVHRPRGFRDLTPQVLAAKKG
jgi:hypothetical protein